MFQNPEKESKKMPLSETEIYKNQHQSEEGYQFDCFPNLSKFFKE